jgi:hypothetical protein
MAMSEFAQGCVWLVVTNVVLVAMWLWAFDSDAARCAVTAGIVGGNIGLISRLYSIRRRERSNKVA